MIVQFNSSLLTLFGIAEKAKPLGGVQENALATTSVSSVSVSHAPTKAQVATEAEEPALVQFGKDSDTFVFGSLDGSVSAVGDLARRMYGERYVREIESSGALFEGYFVAGPGNGDHAAAYGKFADRQNAMINAFHYGREAQQAGTLLAAMKTSDIKWPQTAGTAERGHTMMMAERDVANATAMLEMQFSFMDSVLRTNDDGTTSFVGIEVSHERFGKLMSIDAKGAVTLYDADGTAYSAEAYDAARPDGVIPELANLISGKRGQLSARI